MPARSKPPAGGTTLIDLPAVALEDIGAHRATNSGEIGVRRGTNCRVRRQRITVLAGLLGCFALAGCREPSGGNAADPTDTRPADAKPVAAAPAPGGGVATTKVSLDAKRIAVDGVELTPLRSADAPGALDRAMRPSYRYPKLADALQGSNAVTVSTNPSVTVGVLRGVMASLPPNAGATVVVGKADPLSVSAPAESPSLYVRLRRGVWEVRVDEAPSGEAETIDALAAVVAQLDAAKRSSGIALDLPDSATMETFASVATAVPNTAVLPSDYAPCLEPPEGMVCIPGGPAIVGYDKGLPEEKPQREIRLSTYYIDTHEVTNAKYDACHAAGACPIRINRHQNIMKPFVGPDQPAMPMDWRRARAYCNWAGKQLPTEWEWEKAARGPDGDLYPWGNDEPTCDKSVYRECAPVRLHPLPRQVAPLGLQ